MIISVNRNELNEFVDLYLSDHNVDVVVDYFLSRNIHVLDTAVIDVVLLSCADDITIQAAA